MAKIRCPLCEDHYTSLEGLYDHIDDEHDDSIPKGFTPARYLYYLKTGRTHGKCVVCGKPTEWNEVTNKYHRFCNDPNCKKKYRDQFKKRMIGKYGKVTLLNDPDQQKKMLANRSISGTYKWSDGSEKTYTGTYELDFLKFLDVFMNFVSADIMTPSPHVYYYIYEGEKKFYFPDVFIPSLNLEIEIKDGGNNPNNHEHMIVDRQKEKLKDDVMKSQKEFDYIKIINKNYDSLLEYLLDQKKKFINDNKVNLNKTANIVSESFDVLQTPYDSTLGINNSMLEFDYMSSINIVKESSSSTIKMYPIYAVLFSNDTDFGKMIRKVTGSPYSHATVTLDPSLNDMYSFSDIPYNHASFTGAGFVRESLWSPMYRKNSYFTVLVTFTNEEGLKHFKDKLEVFKQNYTKYKYNDVGLLQYYLNMKNTKNHDEKKKMRWFCSEFVSYMLYSGNKKDFQDILQSPNDIRFKKDMITIGDYTLQSFDENDLKRKTKQAYKKYLEQENSFVTENFIEDDDLFTYELSDEDTQSLMEAKIKDGVKKESDITPYTAMLDWKYLYTEFVSLFPDTNSEIRFDLFEIIIRNYIVPLHINVELTTRTIIDELLKIKSSITKTFGKIINVDIPTKTIIVEKNSKTTSIIYPDLMVRR